jgi:bifunctional DNase/RNase
MNQTAGYAEQRLLVSVGFGGLEPNLGRRGARLLLRENDGKRVLPISVGSREAGAISMQLEGMRFGRPLGHDLLAAVIGGMGGRLRSVIFRRGGNNFFTAEMSFERGDERFSVDARPSDAIAVALRLDAELLVHEDLLQTHAIGIPATPTPR